MNEEVRRAIERELEELDIQIEATGFKSSEGDGRTAADIRRELEQKRKHKESN